MERGPTRFSNKAGGYLGIGMAISWYPVYCFLLPFVYSGKNTDINYMSNDNLLKTQEMENICDYRRWTEAKVGHEEYNGSKRSETINYNFSWSQEPNMTLSWL